MFAQYCRGHGIRWRTIAEGKANAVTNTLLLGRNGSTAFSRVGGCDFWRSQRCYTTWSDWVPPVTVAAATAAGVWISRQSLRREEVAAAKETYVGNVLIHLETPFHPAIKPLYGPVFRRRKWLSDFKKLLEEDMYRIHYGPSQMGKTTAITAALQGRTDVIYLRLREKKRDRAFEKAVAQAFGYFGDHVETEVAMEDVLDSFERAAKQRKKNDPSSKKPVVIVEDLHTCHKDSPAEGELIHVAAELAASLVNMHAAGLINVVYTLNDFRGVDMLVCLFCKRWLRDDLRSFKHATLIHLCTISAQHGELLHFRVVAGIYASSTSKQSVSGQLGATYEPFPSITDEEMTNQLFYLSKKENVETEDPYHLPAKRLSFDRSVADDQPSSTRVFEKREDAEYIVQRLDSHMGDTTACLRGIVERGMSVEDATQMVIDTAKPRLREVLYKHGDKFVLKVARKVFRALLEQPVVDPLALFPPQASVASSKIFRAVDLLINKDLLAYADINKTVTWCTRKHKYACEQELALESSEEEGQQDGCVAVEQ